MTRQEELNEARHEWYLRTQDADFCAGFQKGAEWADAHPVVKVGGALKNYERGYEDAINKACDLLYEYNRKQANKMFGEIHTADVTINVAEFRKAMESSCSEIPNNSKEGGDRCQV